MYTNVDDVYNNIYHLAYNRGIKQAKKEVQDGVNAVGCGEPDRF